MFCIKVIFGETKSSNLRGTSARVECSVYSVSRPPEVLLSLLVESTVNRFFLPRLCWNSKPFLKLNMNIWFFDQISFVSLWTRNNSTTKLDTTRYKERLVTTLTSPYLFWVFNCGGYIETDFSEKIFKHWTCGATRLNWSWTGYTRSADKNIGGVYI